MACCSSSRTRVTVGDTPAFFGETTVPLRAGCLSTRACWATCISLLLNFKGDSIMIKCFLSHSSSDKERYVRIVASKLHRDVRILDEDTFEAGMQPIEEIARLLNETALFVIFLSSHALDSTWVQQELAGAKALFDQSKLEKIYPIIIESGLTHADPRIPNWMRESLNIQPILNPTIAARKISSRLIEISWRFHPRLKERAEIFVGRNDSIRQFEERIDNFSLQKPISIIASGLPSIGRKSLLKFALRKSNVIRASFEFPSIVLSQLDNIEDLIIKTLDLGLTASTISDFTQNTSISDKTNFAMNLFREIINEKERILIEDQGILILPDGQLVDWFSEILNGLANESFLFFIIASRYRPNASMNRTNPLTFSVNVSEMDLSERNGLMVRYSKFLDIYLTTNEYEYFSDLLTGYPEQVLFAMDMVGDQGIFEAKRNSHVIQRYGSDKAKVVLDSYQNDRATLDFIYLLSRFEFISYEVLFDIVDEQQYGEMLKGLLASSICERIGNSPDYIRVNEVIRDYISRNRFGLPTGFEDSLGRHVRSFIERYRDDSSDVSDYLLSTQESLKSGGEIPEDLIIPSVFVKTIKRLYDEDRKYSDALVLADRVLVREKFLHANTISHIRFIKCQCLARLRKKEFFDEVRKIKNPNGWLLYGFYYRLSGDVLKAEENLKRVLQKNPRDPRAMGELVLVYMQGEEYQMAFDLARDNYYNRPGNPINANSYLACLMARDWTPENRSEIESVINNLEIDSSERAREMVASAKARLIAYFDGDEPGAMTAIENTIQQFPEINYPLLTKADLAVHFSDREKLREAVEDLEPNTGKNAQAYRSLVKFKAILLAMDHKPAEARSLVQRELRGLSTSVLDRLIERINQFAA